MPDDDSLSFGNGVTDSPLTIETWFRPDTMARKQDLVSKWWEGAVREYRLYIVPGELRLDLRDGSTQTTVSAIANNLAGLAGGWHHLAVTYDGRGGATAANGITFYIDGVVVPVTRYNNAAYVAMEHWTAPLQVGRETDSFQQYDGALDELRLWNVVRTPSEIQAAMLSELTGAEPGLVAYWRFNEGAGTTVRDEGPGHHTATLYNTVTWMAGGPLAPDVTPPDITNIATSNLTSSSLTVTFTTSEVATGWVAYTAGTACPCTEVYSAAPGTTHVVTLTGLAPDTALPVSGPGPRRRREPPGGAALELPNAGACRWIRSRPRWSSPVRLPGWSRARCRSRPPRPTMSAWSGSSSSWTAWRSARNSSCRPTSWPGIPPRWPMARTRSPPRPGMRPTTSAPRRSWSRSRTPRSPAPRITSS